MTIASYTCQTVFNAEKLVINQPHTILQPDLEVEYVAPPQPTPNPDHLSCVNGAMWSTLIITILYLFV